MTYNPPSLVNETKITTGRQYDVEQYLAYEPRLKITVRTGNGDDGTGVTDWWDDTLINTFTPNFGVTVYGEKVSSEANILAMDVFGTPLEFADSLLSSTEFVINPDLFDANVIPNPDQTFAISTGAPAADQVFAVLSLAPEPDTTFAVETGAIPPDQLFDIKAIKLHNVVTAEPPFIVSVFAKPADQIFDVLVGPPTPNQIFTVTREAGPVDVVYEVKAIDTYGVTVQIEQPDLTFIVTTGPTPPPLPDQIFDVSIGGADAPPTPNADQIFDVEVGPAVPNQSFTVLLVDQSFSVVTAPAPFVVTVGPSAPNAIFDVTVSAPVSYATFAVTTGPTPADQTFDIHVVRFFEVDVYSEPVTYSVTNQPGAYRFYGNGQYFTDNPNLTTTVGQLNNFNVNASGHPFWICNSQTTGGCSSATLPTWAIQLDNNGTQSGQVRVRFSQAGTYYYNCGIHSTMSGSITVS
jgi:hypothetical protein